MARELGAVPSASMWRRCRGCLCGIPRPEWARAGLCSCIETAPSCLRPSPTARRGWCEHRRIGRRILLRRISVAIVQASTLDISPVNRRHLSAHANIPVSIPSPPPPSPQKKPVPSPPSPLARQWGGAISFEDAPASAPTSLSQSARFLHTLSNVTIESAEARIGSGGAIYVKSGEVSLMRVNVTDAASGSSGGCLYVEEGSVTISNSRFVNASAELGGGVAWVGGVVRVENTTALNVSAGEDGGAFFLTTTPTLTALFGEQAWLGPGLAIANASAGVSGGVQPIP